VLQAAQACRPLGIRPGNSKQALGEDAVRAAGLAAAQPAHLHLDLHAAALPGQVHKPTGVAAVPPDDGWPQPGQTGAVMRDRHMTVMWSGMGTTCSTTRSAGTRGRRRLDTGQHELRLVHATCPHAPKDATSCTDAADEPDFDAV